jgi:cytochrome c-type biogenesis protein CcmH/NrfF
MQQPIVSYHVDEFGDWVADLQCGHGQHVRHQPPMTNRPWVLTEEGRHQRLGETLNCKKCDEAAG